MNKRAPDDGEVSFDLRTLTAERLRELFVFVCALKKRKHE